MNSLSYLITNNHIEFTKKNTYLAYLYAKLDTKYIDPKLKILLENDLYYLLKNNYIKFTILEKDLCDLLIQILQKDTYNSISKELKFTDTINVIKFYILATLEKNNLLEISNDYIPFFIKHLLIHLEFYINNKNKDYYYQKYKLDIEFNDNYKEIINNKCNLKLKNQIYLNNINDIYNFKDLISKFYKNNNIDFFSILFYTGELTYIDLFYSFSMDIFPLAYKKHKKTDVCKYIIFDSFVGNCTEFTKHDLLHAYNFVDNHYNNKNIIAKYFSKITNNLNPSHNYPVVFILFWAIHENTILMTHFGNDLTTTNDIKRLITGVINSILYSNLNKTTICMVSNIYNETSYEKNYINYIYFMKNTIKYFLKFKLIDEQNYNEITMFKINNSDKLSLESIDGYTSFLDIKQFNIFKENNENYSICFNHILNMFIACCAVTFSTDEFNTVEIIKYIEELLNICYNIKPTLTV